MICKLFRVSAPSVFILLSLCFFAHADQVKNIYDSKGNIIGREVTIETGPVPIQPSSGHTGASSRGPVISYPQGSSGYVCGEVVGFTFEDLMTHAREAYETKNWRWAKRCSYCAYKELRPSNVEAMILYFKSNYYYYIQKGESHDQAIKDTIYNHLDNIIKDMPNPTLKAYRNWVVKGGEPDNFRIVKTTQAAMYYITLADVNVRSEPSKNGERLGSLKEGFRVKVFEVKRNWARIGEDKWVYKKYLLKFED